MLKKKTAKVTVPQTNSVCRAGAFQTVAQELSLSFPQASSCIYPHTHHNTEAISIMTFVWVQPLSVHCCLGLGTRDYSLQSYCKQEPVFFST